MSSPVEPLIDLDSVRDDVGARTPGGVAVSRRRPLKAAVVVVASLLTAGAVAPAPGPRLIGTLGDRPAVAVALGDDAAFVATDEAPGGSSIRRYGLAGDRSAVQWSAELLDEVTTLRQVASAGVVVAELDPTRSGSGTLVLDATTGRVLWRAAESDVVLLPGRSVLLIGRRADGHPERLRTVDLRSGTEGWRRAVRPDDALLFDPDPSTGDVTRTVVVVGTDGSAVVVGTADGSAVARRSLRLRLRPSDRDYRRDFAEVSVIGTRLYVARRHQGTAAIDAYDLADLAPAWSTRGDPVGRVTDCGGLLCVSDDRTVSTLDPQAATVRWATGRWLFLVPFGAGRLLAYDTGQSSSVVDAATGGLVERLGPGVLVPGSPPTFVRQDSVGGRVAWVLAADPAGDRLRTVGALPDVDAYSCVRRHRLLACRGADGIARVWLLR
jgi:hypothetical protein